MQPDSAAPMYRGSGVTGASLVPLEQRLFPPRHSNRGEWFAIVLAASPLLVMLVAAIRVHEHGRGTSVAYRFRPYTAFLADTTAAAGLGLLSRRCRSRRRQLHRDLTPSTHAALLRLDWLLRNEPATHFRLIARQSTELLATLGN